MQGVLAWLFHRRDIDGLIVGLLLYTALSKLLLDVNEGVFKPAVTRVLFGANEPVDIARVVTGVILTAINVTVAYAIVRLTMRHFPNHKRTAVINPLVHQFVHHSSRR